MECKLSEENTRLEKLAKDCEKRLAEFHQMDREVREKEQEWYHAFEEIIEKVLGYPSGQAGFRNFGHAMFKLIKSYCIIAEEPIPNELLVRLCESNRRYRGLKPVENMTEIFICEQECKALDYCTLRGKK